jgi:hypothetical protein
VLSEGVTTPGTNVNATTGGFCPGSDPTSMNCGFANGADVWYSITPTCSGSYTATTCDAATAVDTVVTIWSGSCGSLVEVGCSDDDFGCAFAFTSSTATWTATAGTTYYISVAGFNGSQGTFNITAGPGGAGLTLTFLTAGTGTIGYQVSGGPPNGLAYTAITLVAGAYPVDWFFGVAMTLNDILFQLAFGFPFVASLDACGNFSIGPLCCLPSGLNVYGVSIAATSATAVATAVSSPANGMVP